MLAHVPSFGRNPRGSPDFLAYPVPKACMHVLDTGVPRRLGVARSASSPKAAQALGCSLIPGLRISFGRVTCMARAASVPGLWTPGFLLLCGACVWVRVVVGLGFRLRPATPGWGDGVCAWLRSRSACTPPLLAGVYGVGVCAWARVSAAPRHSWLGCWGLCVFVCALRLYPATPGWGVRCGCVCLGSGLGCAPQLLAGLLGPVCACVCAPLVPRHSWLGCAVWVCVLGLGFRLRPATPGRGVGVCVCLCARSACTPPLLAGVCNVGVCAWAQVSAAPRHSWLGCWGVCVFVCALRLYHGTRVSVVRCGCVWWRSGFSCAPPLLAGVLACVCLCARSACTPPLLAGVLGCVCLCARSACTPPLLAGVCGLDDCAWARVSAAPRHSWLGCWGVCVLGARSASALPLLAGVCGVGVCFWARVVAAPRLSWLGCWGVRVCVRAPLVPRHSWLGCAVWVYLLGLVFQLRPATPG